MSRRRSEATQHKSSQLLEVSQTTAANLSNTPAANVVRSVLLDVPENILRELEVEGVRSAADLVLLGKDDLKTLGLNMVQRSKIQQWAHATSRTEADLSRMSSLNGQIDAPLLRQTSIGAESDDFAPIASFRTLSSLKSGPGEQRAPCLQRRQSGLDEIESNAEFWCNCFASAQVQQPVDLGTADVSCDMLEDVLEVFFDCTPERVAQVFESMDFDSDGEVSTLEELEEGLRRCRLSGLDGHALAKVLAVVKDRCSGNMHLAEFEVMLSRLRLAQLLYKPVDSSLMVLDYTDKSFSFREVSGTSVRDFFFGHRPSPNRTRQAALKRWVHMPEFNLRLLLALTVKYTLHPLCVEDVIDQCPTKIEQYGANYFLAVELLCTERADASGNSPVRVQGHHVSVSSRGPPNWDTLITVVQADRSFAKDWPGGARPFDKPSGRDELFSKLTRRFRKEGSRVRERSVDFLLYSIVDLCVDKIVAVTRAYCARLAFLEEDLRAHGEGSLMDLGEVTLARLQLGVVARRLRGLQRLIRRAGEDPNLCASGCSAYWRDCADHCDEAYDDALHLAERCAALMVAHEKAMDRGHEERERMRQQTQALQADRLNRTLFFLTAATTIFAPVQLLAGIYGMNFVDKDGHPTIPELLWTDGYEVFLTVIAVYLVLSTVFVVCLYWRLHCR